LVSKIFYYVSISQSLGDNMMVLCQTALSQNMLQNITVLFIMWKIWTFCSILMHKISMVAVRLLTFCGSYCKQQNNDLQQQNRIYRI